jgi:hypothetical protein
MTTDSKSSIPVEGNSLEEAIQKACAALGVGREWVDYRYDREHLAGGASTVRIFAEKRAEPRPPEAQAPSSGGGGGASARGERGGAERADRGGDRRGPRGDGRRDRGGRGRGGGGGGGGDRDRDRGDRGDRGRGPNRRERHPVKDEERDAKLCERARVLAQRVLAGEGPLAIEDLNSYERHLIHTIVAETGGLTSQSIGEGLRKTVHISLATTESPS